MASVNTISFDQAAYTPGMEITATVDYTPDTPSVTPSTFTLTANVVDSNGNTVATGNNTFVVNTPQPGDTVQASSTDAAGNPDGRTWAEGATTVESDGSLSVPFTATA